MGLTRGACAQRAILEQIADLCQQDLLIRRRSRSGWSLFLLLAHAVDTPDHKKDRESHNHEIHNGLQKGAIVQSDRSSVANGFL